MSGQRLSGYAPPPPPPPPIVPYVVTSGSNSTVWQVTQDPGQDPTQVSTPSANVVLSPVASPDASMVAWRNAGDLWVANADGTGETKIYESADFPPGPNGNMRVNGHDWLSDSQLVFGITDAGTSATYYNLSTINSDGTSLTTLYTNATYRVGLPSCSYDRTKIAFWAYTSGVTRELWTMTSAASGVTAAKTGLSGSGVLGDVQDYAWAQASYRLAYRPSGSTYRMVTYDGTGDTLLGTAGPALVWHCWAPDDSAIYYSTTGFFVDLRKIATDGSGTSLVYSDAAHVHGQMCFVTATRVYRNFNGGLSSRGIESVLLDGTGYRVEDGPTVNSYSMF